MGICPYRNFCKKLKEMEKEDVDYIKTICHSSKYEECEDLFKDGE